jgi:signal transduction histidine kinase/ActR/RegA family two-component response regulator
MPWLERSVTRAPRLPIPAWAGYPAGMVAVAVAFGIRVVVGSSLVGVPYITFFPAVILTAVLGGLGPGILATALSVLVVASGVLPTLGNGFGWQWTSILAFGSFGSASLMFCAVVHGFYTALDRLHEARLRESDLRLTLERRVEERTRQLADANQQLQVEMDERSKAEAVARQSHKMEVIGQLTGGIAHDFNNLLTIIMGNIEVAQRLLAEREPQAATRIADAARGAARAAALTQRLLAFARRQPLDPTPVDLSRLVAGMSDLIGRTPGSPIAIETVLAAELWRTRCDANQLESALLNLIVNARDAMTTGGKLTIECANVHLDRAYADRNEEVTPGQYVMIAVTDTGAGIPRDIVQRVFEPFFTTKPAGEGTGLGLSMVFGFVKQSGGHVKIYSEPGHGTTVKIYLPRLVGASADAEPAKQTLPSPARDTAGCVVLVVEDQPEVRSFTVQTLAELGYAVCEAQDGSAALRTLRTEPKISVLLTDVVLPNTDLRALVAEARRLHNRLRVIYTTGYTRNAIVHDGTLDPDVELLPKPFTATTLARKMREASEAMARQVDAGAADS